MLEQQPEPQSPTLPAASARITPEELSRAVAKIESRRAEAARLAEIEAQRQANTVPIGEAVQELALDIAPEELWAEVQAERAQTPLVRPPAPSLTEWPKEPPVRLRPVTLREMAEAKQEGHFAPPAALAGILMLVMLFVVCLATYHQDYSRPPFGGAVQTVTPVQPIRQQPNQSSAPLDAEFYRKLELTRRPKAQYTLFAFTGPTVPPAFQGQPVYPVNALPDGYELGGDFDPWTFWPRMFAFRAAAEKPHPIYPWMFVRYNGKWHYRGWISASDKSRVLKGKDFSLLPNTHPPQPKFPNDTYLALTVPVDVPGFASTSVEFYKWIYFDGKRKIALDNHAWEPEPVPAKPVNETPLWDGRPFFNLRGPQNYYFRAGFDANSVLKPLSSVPDKQTAAFSSETLWLLGQKSKNQPAENGSLLVDVRPGIEKDWTVIKHKGNVYLRGWVANRVNEKQLAGRYLNIYNDPGAPELGLTPTEITVSLETASIYQQAGGSAGFPSRNPNGMSYSATLSNVQLDKYAWEKW